MGDRRIELRNGDKEFMEGKGSPPFYIFLRGSRLGEEKEKIQRKLG